MSYNWITKSIVALSFTAASTYATYKCYLNYKTNELKYNSPKKDFVSKYSDLLK